MARKQSHKPAAGAGAESDLLKEGEASSHVARIQSQRILRSAAVHARIVQHIAGHMLFAPIGFGQEDEKEELDIGAGDEPMLHFTLTKSELRSLFGPRMPAEHKIYNELVSAVEEVTASLRIMFADIGKPAALRAQFAQRDNRPLSYHRVNDYEGAGVYIREHDAGKRAAETAEVYEFFVTFPNMIDLTRAQALWQLHAERFLAQLSEIKAMQPHLDQPRVIGRG